MPEARGRWRPPPLIRSRALRRAIGVAAVAYLAGALLSIDVDVTRLREGIGRGGEIVAAFLAPDFGSRPGDLADGLLESLAMTAVATVAGIFLSIPVALGAARNLSPRPLYVLCRALIAVSRSLQEIVVAILFVVMVGFGPLAGVLTLVFASIGFLAKLLAEEIEAIDPAPLEAVRATGARGSQVVLWGVAPQVLPRLIGLSVYRLDINFRESAVVGVVGAGGIGSTLNTAFQRYEYGTASAVLVLIVAIVMVGELASGSIRRRLV